MKMLVKDSDRISSCNDVRETLTQLERAVQEISKRRNDKHNRKVKSNSSSSSPKDKRLKTNKITKGRRIQYQGTRKTSKANQRILGNVGKKEIGTEEESGMMKNTLPDDESAQQNEEHDINGKCPQQHHNMNLNSERSSYALNTNNRTKCQNRKKTTLHCIDKNTKVQMTMIATKKRAKRTMENQKRREKLERDRVKHLQSNSGESRRARLKRITKETKMKLNLIQDLLICITLGTTLHSALLTVQRFREYKHQSERENSAAKLITRQMRLYKFKRQRQRIRSAIYVLGTCFVAKIRLWKKSRRRLASERLVAFLTKLKDENINSGGSLALIVKGKKWRAYRIKIILLQNVWRQKLKTIEAQVELIDIQWKTEQSKRTEIEIDRIHNENERKTKLENEELESINRTRRLIKLKNLPKIKYKSRNEIMQDHLKGKDLLSIGNIVPLEIRHEIIKETLKHVKRIHRSRVEYYQNSLREYQLGVAELQRRQAFLDGFSDNGTSSDWIWGARKQRKEAETHKTSGSLHHGSNNKLQIPIKPKLRIILNDNTLSKLIELGNNFVISTREAWSPETMKFEIPSCNEIGRKIAQYHYVEIDLVKNTSNKL